MYGQESPKKDQETLLEVEPSVQNAYSEELKSVEEDPPDFACVGPNTMAAISPQSHGHKEYFNDENHREPLWTSRVAHSKVGDDSRRTSSKMGCSIMSRNLHKPVGI